MGKEETKKLMNDKVRVDDEAQAKRGEIEEVESQKMFKKKYFDIKTRDIVTLNRKIQVIEEYQDTFKKQREASEKLREQFKKEINNPELKEENKELFERIKISEKLDEEKYTKLLNSIIDVKDDYDTIMFLMTIKKKDRDRFVEEMMKLERWEENFKRLSKYLL